MRQQLIRTPFDRRQLPKLRIWSIIPVTDARKSKNHWRILISAYPILACLMIVKTSFGPNLLRSILTGHRSKLKSTLFMGQDTQWRALSLRRLAKKSWNGTHSRGTVSPYDSQWVSGVKLTAADTTTVTKGHWTLAEAAFPAWSTSSSDGTCWLPRQKIGRTWMEEKLRRTEALCHREAG